MSCLMMSLIKSHPILLCSHPIRHIHRGAINLHTNFYKLYANFILFKMDTVVKSMLEDDDDEKKGLIIFGRDVSKIPCFRESFINGIATGIGVGLAAFLKTSKPMLSQHIAFGTFSITTLLYWSYCRVQWSKQKFDAQLMQEALKNKIRYEGTAVEKELEEKGVLKSA